MLPVSDNNSIYIYYVDETDRKCFFLVIFTLKSKCFKSRTNNFIFFKNFNSPLYNVRTIENLSLYFSKEKSYQKV